MNDVVSRIQVFLREMDGREEVDLDLYYLLSDAADEIRTLEVTANNYRKACEALEENGKHV